MATKNHRPGSIVRFDKRFKAFAFSRAIPIRTCDVVASGTHIVKCTVTGQEFAVVDSHVTRESPPGLHHDMKMLLVGQVRATVQDIMPDRLAPNVVGICFVPDDKSFVVVDLAALVSIS